MDKRLSICARLAACVVLLASQPSAAQRVRGSQCLGRDDHSTAMVGWIRNLIKGTNIHVDSLRDRIGFRGIDTSSVTVVTDSKTCAAAAAAIDSLAHMSASGRLVYVVKVGKDRLVVQDPRDKTGEWLRAWVFDSHFNLVTALLA